MSQRGRTVLEEIRGRRKYVTEIVAIAIGLAMFINLASNYIFDCIKGGSIFWHIAFLVMPLILLSVFLLRYVYAKTTEQSEITVLFPLIVKTEEIRVEPIKGYSPSFRANALLSPLRKDKELKKEFIQDWRDGIARGALGDDGVSLTSMYKLLIGMLVSLIRLYGEHTLTTTSLYHKEYRTHAWKFKSHSIKAEELQNETNEKAFLRAGALKLPEKVHLSLENKKEKNFKGLRIDSPYCWVVFKILPYWRIITEENSRKSYKIVRRNMKREDAEILTIPVQIIIAINRYRIFSKMVEDYYIWMQGLMSDALKWISWEEYEKGDFERLVVDINQDLQDLRSKVEGRKVELNIRDSS
jgi:hypothetical protein